MVASSRLAGMRSPGRRSPAWTRARSWSRSWTYRGTWDSGWRCTGSIVSHPEPILHEIGLGQEPNCLFEGKFWCGVWQRKANAETLRTQRCAENWGWEWRVLWLTEFGITLTSWDRTGLGWGK